MQSIPAPCCRSAINFCCVACAWLATAVATSAYAGNPGYDRPGLGFSPAVLEAGDFTWEQGLPDWSRADGASLYTADTLLRLGVGGPFELQLGTSYNHLAAPGVDAWGRGDSSVGLKFALPATGDFRWGLLGSVTFTDGARDFRDQDRQYTLGAVFNWQTGPRGAIGAYLETARSGGRNGNLVALNAGRALTGSLDTYVEVAWQHAAGIGDGSMAGAGLAWAVTPRMQLDASFRHRLGGAADTWEAGFGVSVYFGRP
ncbi:MAG: transporter [Rhodanobacteraceae bacterium]